MLNFWKKSGYWKQIFRPVEATPGPRCFRLSSNLLNGDGMDVSSILKVGCYSIRPSSQGK